MGKKREIKLLFAKGGGEARKKVKSFTSDIENGTTEGTDGSGKAVWGYGLGGDGKGGGGETSKPLTKGNPKGG